jgi:hypothetical protein
MRPKYIARGKQERRASDRTKSDLVREFHSAGEEVLAWVSRYVQPAFHRISEILISVNPPGRSAHTPLCTKFN